MVATTAAATAIASNIAFTSTASAAAVTTNNTVAAAATNNNSNTTTRYYVVDNGGTINAVLDGGTMCVVAQKSRNNNTSTTHIVPPSSTTRTPHWASNIQLKYERLALAKEWIEDHCERVTYNYNRYPINHFMCLLLHEMDCYLYSVPVGDLKGRQLHERFTENCEMLKSKNLDCDTYGSNQLYDRDEQIHLQNIYYFNLRSCPFCTVVVVFALLLAFCCVRLDCISLS